MPWSSRTSTSSRAACPFLAFSFGLPVIATDVGSLREDVTSETGLLCRPKDPADLARAITEFYRERLPSGFELEVRARIRSFAEEQALVGDGERADEGGLRKPGT